MLITTRGVVISSRNINENDRSISIISEELGVIDILAKGAGKNSSKNNAATQLFAYASFCFNERNGRYYLNSSQPENIFYGIRTDVVRVALASYFAELVKYAVMALQPSDEIMRLLLNSFYFLSEGSISCGQLKAVFELRFACCIGNTPRLLGCCECHRFSDEVMYFMPSDGKLYCSEHFSPPVDISGGEYFYSDYEMLSQTMLHIMRLVCVSELKKIFSFKIKGATLQRFGDITEKYLMIHLQHRFKTLDFYKEMVFSDNNGGQTNE